MRRKIYQKLLEWKRERKGDVALLIEGARRIGKSFIVEEFARKEYDSYILIDFSKVNPQVMAFFDLYLDDLDTLFLNIELYFRQKLTPRQPGEEEARSLIIFDEVQFCPRARASIKHLVADHRYDYIETGSLISIKKNVKVFASLIFQTALPRCRIHPLEVCFQQWIRQCRTVCREKRNGGGKL